MKNVLFSLLFLTTFVFMVSCTKEQVSRNNNTKIQHVVSGNGTTTAQTYGSPRFRTPNGPSDNIDSVTRQGGGEDDDKPIIMHIVEDAGRMPLQGASVVMINNTDTLQQLTDSDGHCNFELLRKGYWELIVMREGFYPVSTQVSIVDSFQVHISTLQSR